MYESLTTLAKLPDETIVYPGHRYSVPSSGTIAAIRETNYVFKPRTAEMWLQMFGR
jgi:glyoxylase-like metal-dependent hydrolase (beta-lactamase superfamily II)